MAVARPNILIPATNWFNLNTAASIAVGVPMEIQNIGFAEIEIAISVAQPAKASPNTAYRILKRGEKFITDPGDVAVWAYSQSADSYVNIAEVSEALRQPESGFGEVLVVNPQPIAQVTAQYGMTSNVNLNVQDGGSAAAVGGNFVASSGVNPVGISSITAQHLIKYRPGQSLRCRITAIFETVAALNQLACGLYTSEDAAVFGYSGTAFGVIRAYGGNDEAQQLTITTGATSNGNVTVTVNGAPYIVALTTGGANHNAAQIAAALNGVVPAYFVTSNQNKVIAMSNLPGPGGSFAFAAGATGAVASWAQLIAGVQPQVEFIPQSAWNINKAEWLNPAKGNVYEVVIEYLGYGAIEYRVEEPSTGRFITVHRIRYANANTVPSFGNPVFRMGWLSRNIGSTTSATIKGASAAAFIDGAIFRSGPLFSQKANIAALGISPITVMILRSRRYFNGRINRVEVFPQLAFAACQTAKGAFFELIVDPVINGEVIYSYIDEQNSVMEYSLQNFSITGGRSLGTITAEAGAPQQIVFNSREETENVIEPGQVLVIIAQVAQTPDSTAQASLTWQEDY